MIIYRAEEIVALDFLLFQLEMVSKVRAISIFLDSIIIDLTSGDYLSNYNINDWRYYFSTLYDDVNKTRERERKKYIF